MDALPNLKDELQIPSPLKKQRKIQLIDEKGRCICVEPLSTNFIFHFLRFRKNYFHDLRPPGSRNDYGWYPLLKKQWPDWLSSQKAEAPKPPTKNVLDGIWTRDVSPDLTPKQ